MDTVDFEVLQPMNPIALTTPRFAAGQQLAPLSRATIFVRDIDRSLKLYHNLLGMEVMFDHLWRGEKINAVLGRRGLALRAVVLMAGESAQGNLGIYQLLGDDDPADWSIARGGARTGDCALVFPTNDIAGVTSRIETAGYEIVSPVIGLVYRSEYLVQPAEMMFRDDDGVLVNLVQAGVLRCAAPSAQTNA